MPLAQSSLSLKGLHAVAGAVKTIADWEISGGVVVSTELANSRANTCSECPKNVSGDLTTWFTVPAAELIKLQLEARNERKLNTNYDPLLGTCEACGCVNKLSVWCPLDIKLKHMKPEVRAALHPSCWVFSEEAVPDAA